MESRKPNIKWNNYSDEKCKELRNEWLKCKASHRLLKYGFIGTRICDKKYVDYMCKCLDDDERKKRFHCSILATH